MFGIEDAKTVQRGDTINMRVMLATLFGIITMVAGTVYLIFDHLKMEQNRHFCAEYCIPYRHEMADSDTCICYDDRHLEIVSMEKIK